MSDTRDHPRRALDECWTIAMAGPGSTLEDAAGFEWMPAQVPGTAAGALRAAGQWDFDARRDFDASDWWWRLRFHAERGSATLGFDGLATLAEVWLDGISILHSDNMFRAHRVAVELGGEHELLIQCRALTPELKRKRPRPRWRVPMLQEQQLRWFRTSLLGRTPGWSPPCPAVGPWRPVWLQPGVAADPPRIQVHLDGQTGIVKVAMPLAEDAESATLVLSRGRQRATANLHNHDGIWSGDMRLANPDLWWPHTHGEPARYRLSLEVVESGRQCEVELGFCGFRHIEIDREDGHFAVRVNDVEVFCRGACWTPLDVVSLQAGADDCDAAVAQMCAAGMNMLRIGGTMVYEEDALYEALDAHGVLLWQDLMFANMDYPEDADFTANVTAEVEQQLARLRMRPCLALVCGNSEGEQQAAMAGADRECWAPALFHEHLARLAEAVGAAYTPSSSHGGAFPHAANVGAASWFGVGAYLRPLEAARREEVQFASECLAFANIPATACIPGGAAVRVHHPQWKTRAPRDLGAGWDFDDVRDHYVAMLYAIDPGLLRVSDHDRYLALGRVATGEVMAQVFAEWRRARSPTRGGLIWFLRDLWPGAGWGVVDAGGQPKLCWYALRRALAPVAVSISDEGVNGLVVHIVNEHAQPLAATLALSLYRNGDVQVGHGAVEVVVPGRGAIEVAATDLFEGFVDLSFAYRFGPPVADTVHACLLADGDLLADTFHFPTGLPSRVDTDIGLAATVADSSAGEPMVTISARRFAQSVEIEAPGFVAEDNNFHLAPGQQRRIALHASPSQREGPARCSVGALNVESRIRFVLP